MFKKLKSIIPILLIFTVLSSCSSKKPRPLFDAEFAESNEQVKELILSQLKNPLSGYKWSMFQGVMFQKPLNWSEYKTNDIYTTSVESVAKNGKFETGLTIRRVKNIPVRRFINNYIKIHKKDEDNQIITFTKGQQGDSQTYILRYRNAPTNLKPIIVHKFIVANKSENYVLIITFEAPEKNWDKIWEKYGSKILKNIHLLPYEY